MGMSKHESVWATMDAGQLALIKALFESNNIQYYINNENFAQTHGMAVAAEIFVVCEQVQEAKELITAFIQG